MEDVNTVFEKITFVVIMDWLDRVEPEIWWAGRATDNKSLCQKNVMFGWNSMGKHSTSGIHLAYTSLQPEERRTQTLHEALQLCVCLVEDASNEDDDDGPSKCQVTRVQGHSQGHAEQQRQE